MKVMKFGGTSVKDADAIRRVEKILKTREPKVMVVVSALAGITNLLEGVISDLEAKQYQDSLEKIHSIQTSHLALAENLNVISPCSSLISGLGLFAERIVESVDILGEITPKTKDLILAMGELHSSFIIYQYLIVQGFRIAYVDPRSVMKTRDLHGETDVDWESSLNEVNKICKPLLADHDFLLTGGYVGSDESGKTTTLGRGGSDYSAAIFASLLDAEKLEIWTDVDGILTADPRLIPQAELVTEITFNEASELAHFGAKVLHPKTILPSVEKNIPVFVMNTFYPEKKGTRIISTLLKGKKIKAITFRKNITVINIHSNRMLGAFGFLASVFEVFRKYETSIDLVSTSEVSISVTIDSVRNLDGILRDLGKTSSTSVFKEMAIISAIGEGIRGDTGIASRFFDALKGIEIFLVTMGASEINLSIVVGHADLDKAIRNLHFEFFEKENHD